MATFGSSSGEAGRSGIRGCWVGSSPDSGTICKCSKDMSSMTEGMLVEEDARDIFPEPTGLSSPFS
jgi:hypothetical protein